MNSFYRNLRKIAASGIRFFFRKFPFFVNFGYSAKIEILTIIFNEKTGKNDRLHDLETFEGLNGKYRKALNGFDTSKLGLYISKCARKTKVRRESKTISNKGNILFATRSWHFIDPLFQYFKTNGIRCEKYDINDFDEKFFKANRIKNKSKHHRDKAFKNLAVTFRKKQKFNNENRAFVSKEFIDHYENSDVIVVDWLNHNTNWVLENASDDKKIIVRVHSYEVLSFFPATINFGRIDGLIFISHGIKDMFLEMWGWLIPENTLIEVIDNIRCTKRISPNSLGNTEAILERKKIIGMMQYALPVKGFNFAFEVFKRVYEQDSDFKLLLCGQTLNEINSEDNRQLLKEINAMPEGVVKELGYVSDVDSFFKRVGYMLSTSEREGSHESIIEGMAYGCIPIIRNWPLIAPFNGAKRAFPMCNVIESVEEAVEQILYASKHYEEVSDKYRRESAIFYSEDIPKKYFNFIERVRKNDFI
ncbi:glycosyltransferase [Vibrio cholerae]